MSKRRYKREEREQESQREVCMILQGPRTGREEPSRTLDPAQIGAHGPERRALEISHEHKRHWWRVREAREDSPQALRILCATERNGGGNRA